MVVDDLTTDSHSANIGVACIYLNYKETDSQTLPTLLGGLWRQLVLGRNLSSQVHQLYCRHLEKGTKPSLDELRDVLNWTVVGFAKVYLVIDAVDEYPEEQRHLLLEHLAALGPNVNTMLTSRPHITFCSFSRLVTLEIRANEEDIRRYIDGRLQLSPRLSKHVRTRPELREEIHSKIAATVDGMFLLAKLHLDSLVTKTTSRAVREALKTLPKDLNGTYDTAMKRIDDQSEEDRTIAHRALGWVTNAVRPLEVSELRAALAIEPDTQQLDEENLLDIETILSVCAGLVIVNDQFSVVRLVHYTAQDYLADVQAKRFPHVQTEIAHRLLTFMAFHSTASVTRKLERGFWPDLPPLMEYSQYCLSHAAGLPEEELRDLILKFLNKGVQWGRFDCWRWIWGSPPWNFPNWPRDPSALWVAAASNLEKTVMFLLAQGVSPNSSEKEGALRVASYYGHLRVVQLLLEHGADANARGANYGSLQAASQQGHENIVKILIAHGADTNMQSKYGSPLQAASAHGRENIVRLLLEHGANINALGGEDGSALQSASSRGHANIVRQLLERGADVNMHGGRDGSALSAAASRGDETIVRLLIERGANPDEQNGPSDLTRIPEGKYGSALEAASSQGHENIVQLLIEKGANVNAANGWYRTALQAARFKGHNSIVKILIDHGANTSGSLYFTETRNSRQQGEWRPGLWVDAHGRTGPGSYR